MSEAVTGEVGQAEVRDDLVPVRRIPHRRRRQHAALRSDQELIVGLFPLCEAFEHRTQRLQDRHAAFFAALGGFGDADDIASVLHYRLARATARPAGSGRARKAPQLIAGLIPEATGEMSAEMQDALTERRELIEQRANEILDRAVSEKQDWALGLGESPAEQRATATWRREARTVAAYRDRYGTTAKSPLGRAPDSDAQKIDFARAAAALTRLRDIAAQASAANTHRTQGRDRLGLMR